MYKISEFAAVCGTTSKTIRFYDSAGVLEADYIDSLNGYRYYSSDKVQQYYKIISLKQIGFTIDEIKTRFLNVDDNAVLSVLKEKESKLLQAYQNCKEIISVYEEKIKMLNENQNKKVNITCDGRLVTLDDGNILINILCDPEDVEDCKNAFDDILNIEGFIQVPFDDIVSIVNSNKPVEVRHGIAVGEDRVTSVVKQVIPSRKDVQALIIFKISPEVSLSEIENANIEISNYISTDSTTIWGISITDKCKDFFEITAVYFQK